MAACGGRLRDRRHRPDPSGPWQVTITVAEIDGAPRCVGVSVADPLAGTRLTVDTVRKAFKAALVEEAIVAMLAQTLDTPEGEIGLAGPKVSVRPGRVAVTFTDDLQDTIDKKYGIASPLGGQRPLNANDYREVAEIYIAAHERGEGPVKAVESARGCSYSWAAELVSRCRNDLGLLPKTTQGTPKA